MTPRQQLAIANLCARAHEALRGEFSRMVRVGSMTLSTILTVNK
jgi:hypothetical protein